MKLFNLENTNEFMKVDSKMFKDAFIGDCLIVANMDNSLKDNNWSYFQLQTYPCSS